MSADHVHDHAHDEAEKALSSKHDGHSHAIAPNADRRYLVAALALIVAFMIVEVIVAVVSGSLALLSDAGHMLTDAGAIAAPLWAINLAGRPARGIWTFGFKRAEILSAAANGITLLVISALVAVEAIHRLLDPPPVAGGPVLVVAIVGVIVNLMAVSMERRRLLLTEPSTDPLHPGMAA